ncbi:MAG: iron-containing alcohol dehydrogenase [Clostridiales bacterium]|nr:iron-containing alcohol dehydrogenase [Clostridiales bacterium]
MGREFFLPNRIISGTNALKEMSEYISEYGKKALIVTGKTVCTLDGFQKLTTLLSDHGVAYAVFTGITGEPDDRMIKEGVDAYLSNNCDFLIGMGGGSPIDSMKAIAVWVATKKNVCDYYGTTITAKLPNMVAIPTTAGTGSEATQFTVITDTKSNVKMLLKGKTLMPDLAVIDASLSMSSPKNITAFTGLDALTHAVESYTSRRAQPLTDDISLSAVTRIFKYLVRAYNDGNDIEARTEMSIAALEAGIAINNASVTLVHGMSRPIGVLFHVPHGLSNAMLLAQCMKFACDAAYEKFAALARAVGVATFETDDKTAAYRFVEALHDICKQCDIPTLSEYGIDKKDFCAAINKMADDALVSGSPSNTIKEVTKADIVEIYEKLFS